MSFHLSKSIFLSFRGTLKFFFFKVCTFPGNFGLKYFIFFVTIIFSVFRVYSKYISKIYLIDFAFYISIFLSYFLFTSSILKVVYLSFLLLVFFYNVSLHVLRFLHYTCVAELFRE